MVAIPSESQPIVPKRTESQPIKPIEAKEADTDTVTVIDTDRETEKEKDSDIGNDTELNFNKVEGAFDFPTSGEEAPDYSLWFIEDMANELDEKYPEEYPYVSRLVQRFYEINKERGWRGTDGKPIHNIVEWYMQFLDYELDNGYQLKYASVCEE